jgi:hypothetical protein
MPFDTCLRKFKISYWIGPADVKVPNHINTLLAIDDVTVPNHINTVLVLDDGNTDYKDESETKCFFSSSSFI